MNHFRFWNQLAKWPWNSILVKNTESNNLLELAPLKLLHLLWIWFDYPFKLDNYINLIPLGLVAHVNRHRLQLVLHSGLHQDVHSRGEFGLIKIEKYVLEIRQNNMIIWINKHWKPDYLTILLVLVFIRYLQCTERDTFVSYSEQRENFEGNFEANVSGLYELGFSAGSAASHCLESGGPAHGLQGPGGESSGFLGHHVSLLTV
jgi:hypothetical protein